MVSCDICKEKTKIEVFRVWVMLKPTGPYFIPAPNSQVIFACNDNCLTMFKLQSCDKYIINSIDHICYDNGGNVQIEANYVQPKGRY